MPEPTTSDGGPVVDVEPLVAASRVISAIVVRSLSGVTPAITVAQLRVLVMVGRAGPLTMNEVAQGLAVNASNASRSCDRLVTAGLLLRDEHPEDRRRVALTLSPRGHELIEDVMERRRKEFEEIVAGMPADAQRKLMAALEGFVDAVGEDRRHDALVGDLLHRGSR